MKRRRQILEKLKITEISGVDRPCQEHARMTIMKRTSPSTDLVSLQKRVAKLQQLIAPVSKAGFDPNEPRDESGKWSTSGSGGSVGGVGIERQGRGIAVDVARYTARGYGNKSDQASINSRAFRLASGRRGQQIAVDAFRSKTGFKGDVDVEFVRFDSPDPHKAKALFNVTPKEDLQKFWSLAARVAALAARRLRRGVARAVTTPRGRKKAFQAAGVFFGREAASAGKKAALGAGVAAVTTAAQSAQERAQAVLEAHRNRKKKHGPWKRGQFRRFSHAT